MSLGRIELKQHVDLRAFTTIKIGGCAQYFFVAATLEELNEIIKDAGPFCYILGGGSNLLVKDQCLKKPVIKLGSGFDYLRASGQYIEVGAATKLSRVLNYCLKNNLSGLHNLAGIPATIGGLLCMNASSFNGEIFSPLVEAEVMDKMGAVIRLSKKEITFGYRRSSLKNYIILRAWFTLHPDSCIKADVSNFLKIRRQKQDFDFPSCGCIFKNPLDYSAGFLIESCGLKGVSRGGAQVSNKHANFIINRGNASYDDVSYLIKQIKDKVHQKFGVVLEEEIERWE
ncbi:MAG: UDP-N-acetylmuramate dehydrogenase [Candidatus Omnitrophica bacterium]|nr:UDP-N-acetylmuramate dehydrogenase [Candidatus Omnitrophota bacterium]